MHPTVKPVALVADAIRDCSKRGGIVLDPFGGSGTTLIAAEKTGRARLARARPDIATPSSGAGRNAQKTTPCSPTPARPLTS